MWGWPEGGMGRDALMSEGVGGGGEMFVWVGECVNDCVGVWMGR